MKELKRRLSPTVGITLQEKFSETAMYYCIIIDIGIHQYVEDATPDEFEEGLESHDEEPDLEIEVPNDQYLEVDRVVLDPKPCKYFSYSRRS